MKPKPLPCPFCGCACVSVWWIHGPVEGEPDRATCECSEPFCGATGPLQSTERAAIEAWNGPHRAGGEWDQ
jgi:hypothetical protein